MASPGGFREDVTLCRCDIPKASFFSGENGFFLRNPVPNGKRFRWESLCCRPRNSIRNGGTSGSCTTVAAAKNMKRYLLPCRCSERVVVTAGQAGDEVRCPACGGRLTVPRLGGLTALEQAPAEPTPRPQWTVGHGWGLAGLLVATASLIAAVGLRSCTVGSPLVGDAEIRAAVAASDIATVHRAYRDMARSGVQRPPLPEEARNQRIFRSAEAFSWLLWAAAAGGAAVAAVAFGLARGPRQRVVDDG